MPTTQRASGSTHVRTLSTACSATADATQEDGVGARQSGQLNKCTPRGPPSLPPQCTTAPSTPTTSTASAATLPTPASTHASSRANSARWAVQDRPALPPPGARSFVSQQRKLACTRPPPFPWPCVQYDGVLIRMCDDVTGKSGGGKCPANYWCGRAGSLALDAGS